MAIMIEYLHMTMIGGRVKGKSTPVEFLPNLQCSHTNLCYSIVAGVYGKEMVGAEQESLCCGAHGHDGG